MFLLEGRERTPRAEPGRERGRPVALAKVLHPRAHLEHDADAVRTRREGRRARVRARVRAAIRVQVRGVDGNRAKVDQNFAPLERRRDGLGGESEPRRVGTLGARGARGPADVIDAKRANLRKRHLLVRTFHHSVRVDDVVHAEGHVRVALRGAEGTWE